MRYIYIFFFSLSVFSQNVIVEVDTNYLRIGEQFNLKLKVYGLDKDKIVWPDSSFFSKGLEVIDHFPASLHAKGDTYSYKNYRFTSFDTGTFYIDSVLVTSMLNDSLFSNTLQINFLSTPIDTTNQFFDIKPPKKIPFLVTELLIYAPYLLLFIFIILCLFLLNKYLTSKTTIDKPILEPSIPIDLYFLNKIIELEKNNYLDAKKYKDFYTELSEIFRGYLELRFQIPALESSTHELKGLLHNLKISENWLNPFFRNNDIVKFAKGIPSDDDSRLFLNNVRDFIKKFGVSDVDVLCEDQKINNS